MAVETSLRARQIHLTREAILEALTAIVVERGATDFSIQEVADRAGVSHRTVYRHFPSREALEDGIVEWVESQLDELGGRKLPQHADEVAPLAQAKFRAFDRLWPLVVAGLEVDAARRIGLRQSALSRVATRAAVREVTGHLAGADADAVSALIRQIASTRMWHALKQDEGIEGEAAARAVVWTLESLIAELRAGRGPGADER